MYDGIDKLCYVLTIDWHAPGYYRIAGKVFIFGYFEEHHFYENKTHCVILSSVDTSTVQK